ncbi:glycerol kinase [Chloroflexota bacterium]
MNDKHHKLLTVTAIAKVFEIPRTRMNLILSELGWIAKDNKGWQTTELGKRLGGVQSKDKISGIPYVRWPEVVVNNNILVTSVREAKGEVTPSSEDKTLHFDPNNLDFREKFEAKLRATDGHFVRSKAEVIIDNWLYHSRIAHAYERRLPIEENQYCDFFVNIGKGVYIEYWGYESDPKYLSRKEKKRETYKKYDLHLIELTDKEVSNIDDELPKKLRKFEISVE